MLNGRFKWIVGLLALGAALAIAAAFFGYRNMKLQDATREALLQEAERANSIAEANQQRIIRQQADILKAESYQIAILEELRKVMAASRRQEEKLRRLREAVEDK